MALMIFVLLAAAQTTAPAPPIPEKPKFVCRESEGRTGSHMRSARQCKTEEQWQAEDAARDRIPATLRVTEGQRDATTKDRPQ